MLLASQDLVLSIQSTMLCFNLCKATSLRGNVTMNVSVKQKGAGLGWVVEGGHIRGGSGEAVEVQQQHRRPAYHRELLCYPPYASVSYPSVSNYILDIYGKA